MNKVFINAAIIIIGFLSYSHQTVKHVNDCPKNEQSWKQRSSTFQCDHPNEEYHCLQNIEHDLIETCMKVYNIPSYKVGCPWVKIYNEKAYLRNPFIPCDPMHTGCPQQSHRKYRSNELYIYPECIKSGITTTSVRTDPVTERTLIRTSTQERHDKVSSISPCFSLVIVLGCMIFIPSIFFIGQRFRGKNPFKLWSTANNENKCHEEVDLLSDLSNNTREKPACNESYYAETNETDINVSNRTIDFKNSSSMEQTRESSQHSALVNLEIFTTTDNGESISKATSTRLDELTATTQTADNNKFPKSAKSSSSGKFSACNGYEVYRRDISPVVSSSDDETTPLVRNKEPNKRKRYNSEPVNSKNVENSPGYDKKNGRNSQMFFNEAKRSVKSI